MDEYTDRFPLSVAVVDVAFVAVICLGLQLRSKVQTNLGTLYHRPVSPTCRCLWIMKELGISDAISLEVLEDTVEDAAGDSFVSHDGLPMKDSVATCMYLADSCGHLLPSSFDLSNYYSWISSAGSLTESVLRPLTRQIYGVAEEERNVDLVTSLTSRHGVFMKTLDKHLMSREFVCGNRLTVADVILGYAVFWSGAIHSGNLLLNFPNVRAYLERLNERDGFADSMGPPRDWIKTMTEPRRHQDE